VTEIVRHATDLHKDLERFVEIAERYKSTDDERTELIRREMHDYLLKRLVLHGIQLNMEEIDNLLSMDIEFNAKGLDVWLERR
jgi:hypothetical protein